MMNSILELLAQQFTENLGNRITPALANGIIFSVDQAMKQSAPPADPPTDTTGEQ